jgi:hypothetical protein
MTYTVFAGCSYTEGDGLVNGPADENLWVNILHNSHPVLSNTKILNVGESGASNSIIFKNAINAISTVECKYLFVSWTELLRLYVNPVIETYPTGTLFSYNSKFHDVNLHNGISYSASYIENIKNRLFDLLCPHYNIVELIKYTLVLQNLCEKLKIQVFFINALATEWDKDYFLHIIDSTRTPRQTTSFTQKLLNADTRNDDEYFKIYDKIHAEYKGILNCNWLNLYECYRKHFYLDKALDNLHPGIKSNRAFADFLIEKLKDLE